MPPPKFYPVEEALKAQKALRDTAGLAPEEFPIQAFVGMISEEIETLRGRGKSDQEIADLIQASSPSGSPPEERHGHRK